MTIFGITLSAAVVWLIAAAVFAIIEAATLGLTPIWLQGLLFLVVSILLLYFTRPVVKKKFKVGKEKTNVNALIGKEGLVLETIRPFSAGQVKLDGLEWSAAAADPHMTIESGTAVKVEHIEGVKLIVTPCA